MSSSSSPLLPTEALRCLKKTLEMHDVLLGCPVHRSQPDFMALFASMCDMMLVGLEHLIQASQAPGGTMRDGLGGGGTRSEGTTPSYGGESIHHHMDVGAEAAARGRGRGRGQDGSGNFRIVYVHQQQSHQSDMKVSQLVLDADDEIHVLRSLLASRTDIWPACSRGCMPWWMRLGSLFTGRFFWPFKGG